MTFATTARTASGLLAGLLLASSVSFAQAPVPTPPLPPVPPVPAAPATPPSPVNGMRNKLSAGDLLSAESILEVHRQKNGEDGPYVLGLSWLARGALLLGDLDKAKGYAADVRRECSARVAKGARIEKDHDLEIALGAAIEVEAQRLQRTQGTRPAAAFVKAELAQIPNIPALQSRLHKRLNLLTLTGQAAPELVAEDAIGPPPTLASLKGKPVVLFVWDPNCGDCRAQAPSLARVRAKHASDGVELVTLTRYYDDELPDPTEKARTDSVWKAVYADVGSAPSVISTASMEQYGGSSTPTFVFIDRAGMVRSYTPTRLTEVELDRRVAAIAAR